MTGIHEPRLKAILAELDSPHPTVTRAVFRDHVCALLHVIDGLARERNEAKQNAIDARAELFAAESARCSEGGGCPGCTVLRLKLREAVGILRDVQRSAARVDEAIERTTAHIASAS